ncbi:GNAT family N-acetyltransferase [Marinobacter sp.]|uniref:GNAT family N-acetyltransferase n=1 Tax=Marinobacter sp. TaxID=50741 RepID=UPI0035C6B640
MKDAYRKLCETEPTIPLFSQAWWLDVVAGDDWDVVLVEKGGQYVGALPFVERTRLGFCILTQPGLSQALGPWIKPFQKSYPKKLAFEKDVLGALADGLPNYHHYSQNWSCGNTNWLPFYWRGFTQTTRYTYRLVGLGDKDKLWSGLQQNIRGDIRKARERFGLTVRQAQNIEEYLQLNRMTFERQGLTQPYSDNLIKAMDQAAASRSARDCLVAVDEKGQLHAGVYIVRQGDSAYYLLGGGNPDLRNSGATSLVLWEAICRQPEKIDIFDFEGSMIEPIERFFRAFGAEMTPYFEISHTPSRVFGAIKSLRQMVRR